MVGEQEVLPYIEWWAWQLGENTSLVSLRTKRLGRRCDSEDREDSASRAVTRQDLNVSKAIYDSVLILIMVLLD